MLGSFKYQCVTKNICFSCNFCTFIIITSAKKEIVIIDYNNKFNVINSLVGALNGCHLLLSK